MTDHAAGIFFIFISTGKNPVREHIYIKIVNLVALQDHNDRILDSIDLCTISQHLICDLYRQSKDFFRVRHSSSFLNFLIFCNL